MKVKSWLWCLITTFVLSVGYACSNEDEVDTIPTVPPQTTPSESIIVDTMECNTHVIENIDFEGAVISFITKTNKTFFVTSPQEWIELENPNGRAVTEEFTINAIIAPNRGETREGIICVTFDDKETTIIEIRVLQNGADVLCYPEIDFSYTQQFKKAVYAWESATWRIRNKIEIAELLGVSDWDSAILNKEISIQAYTNNYELTGDISTNKTSRMGFYFDENGCVTTPGGNPNPSRVCVEFDTTTYLNGKFSTMAMNVELGNEYKAIWTYIYNDKRVNVEYTIKIVEEVEFDPGINYTFDIEQEINTSYSSVWWDISDKKDEIAETLKVDDWDAAVADGTIQYKTFKSDGTYSDNFTSNSGYWVDAKGFYTSWNAGSISCTEGLSTDLLSGGILHMPWGVEINTTYPIYIVYWNSVLDIQYVVKINYTIKDKAPDPLYNVMKTYELEEEWVVSAQRWYDQGVDYNIKDIVEEFPELIGGDIDVINLNYIRQNGELSYQHWWITDGWFSMDGAVMFDLGAAICCKPYADGTMWIGARGDNAKAGDSTILTIQYGNSQTMNCVNVKIKFVVVE